MPIQVRLVILFCYTHFIADHRTDCIADRRLESKLCGFSFSEKNGYTFELFQVSVAHHRRGPAIAVEQF